MMKLAAFLIVAYTFSSSSPSQERTASPYDSEVINKIQNALKQRRKATPKESDQSKFLQPIFAKHIHTEYKRMSDEGLLSRVIDGFTAKVMLTLLTAHDGLRTKKMDDSYLLREFTNLAKEFSIEFESLFAMLFHLHKFFGDEVDELNVLMQLPTEKCSDANRERINLRFEEFFVSCYTIQGEIGGPYRKINEDFQLDKLHNDEKSFDTVEAAGAFRTRALSQDNDRFPELFSPYSRMRKFRSGETDLVSSAFIKLYKKRKHIPEERVFWRGMNSVTGSQFEEFVEGEEFYWSSFVSASTDRAIGEKFCRKDQDDPKDTTPAAESVLFRITVAPSVTVSDFDPHHNERRILLALKMDKLSQYPEEKEVLLYPNHKFRIDRVLKDSHSCQTNFPGRGIVRLVCLGFNGF